MSYNKNREFAKKRNNERSELYSKNKLEGVLKKKFTTTIVGALAAFEDEFGWLWGLDKDEDEQLTQDEERMEKAWESVRTDILNRGNNQLRAALEELSLYTVQYNKYQMNFTIKNKGEGRYESQF